ncbi:MAG TPA: hypothetical protein VD931_22800 [Baekduia sp.]|nr:hypothetical protein [Baekduia sp.]
METQALLEEFRAQVADEAAPHLWSDDEVLRYMIDAQDMLVRRFGGITDVTVAAADIGSGASLRLQDLAVTLNTPLTAHSQYILRIRSGRLVTARRDVQFLQESDLSVSAEAIPDYGSFGSLTLDDTDTGQVQYGVLGIKEKNVRWVKVPDATDTCRLHVYRLPYPRITDWDAIPLEIDEHHHMHLLKWMKYLAYSKQDAETRDDEKAELNRQAFEAYAKEVKQEVERRRYRPRVVQYGGL